MPGEQCSGSLSGAYPGVFRRLPSLERDVKQCIYCARTIWFWEHFGWLVARKGPIYWHVKCRPGLDR